ncbi:MAG TPA: glycosyltransferase family 1 protein [bacterium]|nr:glycosyltransferase family 1 protein [bacterium]
MWQVAEEPGAPAANRFIVRILINAVSARMGGSATHLPNFLRTAGLRYPSDTFVACVNARWPAPQLPGNVRLIRTGELRGRLAHAVWDQWGITRVQARERPDVLVSLLNFGPVRCRVPHVVFQRNPVYFCDYYLRGLTLRQTVMVTATRALAHAVMRGARRVVTPSAAMRDMIRAFYPGLPAERFRVVPHGFGLEAFRTTTPLPAEVAAVLARSEGTRLLYVSHAASYKGVEILLEATRLLRDAQVPSTTWLTIAPEDWPEGFPRYEAFIKRHALADRVRLLGRVPHGAVHHVYAAADLFVHPSLCESFAFPLVEAMASGVPVIAADRPLNHEMCGDAAAFYPPEDPAALASEITRLRGDADGRRRMADRGQVLARRFSWERHVDEVMDVVRGVAAAASVHGD